MFFAIAALIYGGWKTWPWWSPLAALAVLIPLSIIKLIAVNNWRAQTGLSEISAADFAASMALNLALLFAAFFAARGARKLFSRRRSSQKL